MHAHAQTQTPHSYPVSEARLERSGAAALSSTNNCRKINCLIYAAAEIQRLAVPSDVDALSRNREEGGRGGTAQ